MIFAAWLGVDETVVEKFAKEAGRTPWNSFLTGDLLLFLFLVAGIIGGFVLGYYWKALFSGKDEP